MGRSEATKFSTMKASIILCLLLKLSKAIGEDVANTTLPCFDEWDDCTYNYIEKYCFLERVAQNCRKSCGLCPGMTPANSFTCFDKWGNCRDNVEEYCYKKSVRQNCPKSCGLCPGVTQARSYTCWDEWANCPALASSPEKDCNPEWVSQEYRKCCGLCN